jgi:ribosomal-protein-alanine N-acetyltransferase
LPGPEFAESLGVGTTAVARLEALVEPWNNGSVHVVEGVGFRREGLLRAYLDLDKGCADALLYSRLRDDTEDAAR